jgi:hypothetical protein
VLKKKNNHAPMTGSSGIHISLHMDAYFSKRGYIDCSYRIGSYWGSFFIVQKIKIKSGFYQTTEDIL